MICFNIFYQNSLQTVIEVERHQSILEVKAIISTAIDCEFSDLIIYLGDYGIIEGEEYMEMPLIALGLEQGRRYELFVYNRNNLFNLWKLCCSQKILGDNPVTQVGYLVEYGNGINKSKFPVCYACSNYCHKQGDKKEILLENNFYCMCVLNSGQNNVPKCKFAFCINLEQHFIKEKQKENLDLTFSNLNSILKFHAEKLFLREKNKIDSLNKEILARNFDFERSVKFGMQRVKMYELNNIQDKILTHIPVEDLNKEAKENSKNSKLDLKDEFVKSLLKWFKQKFFTWCDKPICELCKLKSSTMIETVSPNEEEHKWLASRTEVYSCQNCKQRVRFPRYNNPVKLCDTKTGRCGEWANLFGAILRCFKYDARFVDNFEDHVWNEYYSESLKRWVHVDSCENAWDTPLLYEQGWGRNMTFILAHSIHGVYEVTRRYVKDWDLISSRRRISEEARMNYIIEQQNNLIREDIQPELVEYLANRDIIEQIELLKVKTIKEAENAGRQSGSEEWRKNRGELK